MLSLEHNVWIMLTTSVRFRLHGLAHVELNAVELAWDTVARFSPVRLPQVGFRPGPV